LEIEFPLLVLCVALHALICVSCAAGASWLFGQPSCAPHGGQHRVLLTVADMEPVHQPDCNIQQLGPQLRHFEFQAMLRLTPMHSPREILACSLLISFK
jgi:hypothetical protein